VLAVGRDPPLPARRRARSRRRPARRPGHRGRVGSWDDESRRWTVTSADARAWDADAVVVATGQLHRPEHPRIAGCDSWYRDATGRIVANWPGYMREYEARLRTLDPSEFTFVPIPERSPSPVA
jgi:hypothetical protein